MCFLLISQKALIWYFLDSSTVSIIWQSLSARGCHSRLLCGAFKGEMFKATGASMVNEIWNWIWVWVKNRIGGADSGFSEFNWTVFWMNGIMRGKGELLQLWIVASFDFLSDFEREISEEKQGLWVANGEIPVYRVLGTTYSYQLNKGWWICSLDLLGGGLDLMATFVINFMQRLVKQTNHRNGKKRRFRDF